MPHLVATALAGAALALLPAVPAGAAQPADRTTDPTAGQTAGQTAADDGRVRTELRLTLTYPETNTSGTRAVTLRCDPQGGSHPNAAKACADLNRQKGNPAREPDANTMCTMMYSPVVAAAKGTWRGRPVDFRQEFPNDCSMRSQTGSLFAF